MIELSTFKFRLPAYWPSSSPLLIFSCASQFKDCKDFKVMKEDSTEH